jgi:hypothetical protein
VGKARALYNLEDVYHAKGKSFSYPGPQDGNFPEEVRNALQAAVDFYKENLSCNHFGRPSSPRMSLWKFRQHPLPPQQLLGRTYSSVNSASLLQMNLEIQQLKEECLAALEMHMYFLESLKPFPNTTRRHYY